MNRIIATGIALLVLISGSTLTADADLKGVKCIMNGKPVDATTAVDYKGGKVYFCCQGCAGKFAKDKEKYATKANYQLVTSKQYKQAACPFSGGDLDESLATKVADTEVSFCCGGCQSKVAKAKDDAAKLKLVFNDKAFKKGFEKVSKK